MEIVNSTVRDLSPDDRRAAQIAVNKEIGEGVDPASLVTDVLTVDQMGERLVWIGGAGAGKDVQSG